MATFGNNINVVDKHVGQMVRLHRKAIGIPQVDFSVIIGIPLRKLQKFEWGLERPSPKQLRDICITLDICPPDLFVTMAAISPSTEQPPFHNRGVI